MYAVVWMICVSCLYPSFLLRLFLHHRSCTDTSPSSPPSCNRILIPLVSCCPDCPGRTYTTFIPMLVKLLISSSILSTRCSRYLSSSSSSFSSFHSRLSSFPGNPTITMVPASSVVTLAFRLCSVLPPGKMVILPSFPSLIKAASKAAPLTNPDPCLSGSTASQGCCCCCYVTLCTYVQRAVRCCTPTLGK